MLRRSRQLAVEVFEDRRMLAGLWGFDPLAALPDPVVSVAALSPTGIRTQTSNIPLKDGLAVQPIVVDLAPEREELVRQYVENLRGPFKGTGFNPLACLEEPSSGQSDPSCDTSVGTGPIVGASNTEVVWLSLPGPYNFDPNSWFQGSVAENIATLGLAIYVFPVAALTYIDHFEGYVDGPEGRIWEFNKRAPGTQSLNVGNTLGSYVAHVFADDFAGHSSKQTVKFEIIDDDAQGPDFIALVGFTDGTTIEIPDDENRTFYWIVEDRDSGLSAVTATLGARTTNGRFDPVAAGAVFRNQGALSTNHLPIGTHTLSITATDADNDRTDDATSKTIHQRIKIVDDDQTPPRIVLSGPSGTASDEDHLVFVWEISDESGIHSSSVVVKNERGKTVYTTNGEHNGSFDFRSLPPGHTYTITVTATDNDADRSNSDRSSTSETRSVYVDDDDKAAPVIRFTNGAGNALLGTSYSESHGVSNGIVWNVSDQSGVHAVQGRLYRDGILLRELEGPADKVELLDNDGLGKFYLELTATEKDTNQWPGDQQTTVASATLTVTNAAPNVSAGGPYVVTEGQPLAVIAAGTDADPGDAETLVYDWDLDLDGQYDDAHGAQPTLTWNQLAGAGIADDGTYTVRVRARDIFAATATSSATITVYNAPPQVEAISAAPFIDENTTITATGLFSDPSPFDTHQVVVYWGDGTSSTASVDPSSRTFTATHHYADDRPSDTPFDDYVLRVEVVDDDGAVNPERLRVLSVETRSVGAIELPSFPLSLPTGVSGRLESATVLVDPQSATVATVVGQPFDHRHYYDYPSSGPFDLAGTWTSTVSAGGTHIHTLDIPSQTKTFTGTDLTTYFQKSTDQTFSMLPARDPDGFVPSSGLPDGYEHDHPLSTQFNTTTSFLYYPANWQTIVNTNFSGSFPSNLRLTGNAFRNGNPASLVTLTRPENGQLGSLIVDSVGSPVKEFDFNVDMWVGGGTGADGMSFGLGSLSNTSVFGETGVSTGLWVTFDTYDNGNDEGVSVYYNGNRIKYWPFDKSVIRQGHWDDLRITMTSSGVLTIRHVHTGTLSTTVSGWNPQAGWRFGIGARTGGATDWHEIDNLSILAKYDMTQTVTHSNTNNAYILPRFTASGTLKSATVTLDSPSQSVASADGGQFTHVHDLEIAVGPFAFAAVTSPASSLTSHTHSVDFATQQKEFSTEADLAAYFLQESNLRLPQVTDSTSTILNHSHTLEAGTVPFTTVTQFTYDVASAVVRVRNVAPHFTQLSLPSSVSEHSIVELTGTLEDRSWEDTLQVFVDWADGTTDTIAIPPGQFDFSIQHLYSDDNPSTTANDRYAVRVTAQDDDGGQTVASLDLTIHNESPVLSVESAVSVPEGTAFELPTVIFADRGQRDTHSVITTWGDGSVSTGRILQGAGRGIASDRHLFRDDGVYTVTATVHDDDSGAASTSWAATVVNAPPTIVDLRAAGPAIEGAGFRLTAAATDPGLDDVLTYSWDFGDGSAPATGINLTNVVHTYADEGVYTATLTVDDSDGGQATRSLTFVVPDLSEGVMVAAPTEIDEGATFPLTLTTLTSQAQSAIASWTVHWGDGSSQTFTSAGVKTHSYSDGARDHTISVELNKSAGGKTTLASLPVHVRNVLPTIAGLDGATTGLEKQSLRFSAIGADPGADELTYIWDFGDGTPTQSGKELFEVHHAYADDGAYVIRLRVEDGEGTSAEARLPVVVSNVAPTISLAGAVSAAEGQLYSLTLGTVTDPGTDTVSQWIVDWGDGSADFYDHDGVVTHPYPDGPNGHTITVSLVDEDGIHSRVASRLISVSNLPPEIHSITSITGDESVYEADRINLLASVTDPAGPFDVLTYRWDFGDGTPGVQGINLVNVFHEYPDDGLYTVTLTVTDEDLQSDVATIDITVVNVAPTTAVAGVPQAWEGQPYEVRFAPVLDPGIDRVTEWIIDWGDGTSDRYPNPQNASHIYRDGPLMGEVVVTLVDEDGTHTRAGVLPVAVHNVAPRIEMLEGPSSAPEGSPVEFRVTAKDPAGILDPPTYRWDFGDGSPVRSGAGLNALSHTFADDGLYLVTVEIDDGDGGSDSRAMQVLVENVTPVISLPSEHSVLEASPFALVLGEITDPGDDTVVQWLVDWGDGSSDVYTAASTVTHRYPDGHHDYIIRVGLFDEEGAYLNAGSHAVRVDNAPPVIVSLPEDTTSPEGGLIEFAVVADDPALAADTLTYSWDFGDGSPLVTSSSAAVEHVFPDSGAYTITVTVADEDGGSVSAKFTHTVADVAPTITLDGSGRAQEGTPYTLVLADIDDPGLDTVTQWRIDWGDGSPEESYATGGSYSHTYLDGPDDATVTVTLVDEDGIHIANVHRISILNLPPVVVSLSGDVHGLEGDLLRFTGSAVDPAGGNDALTYVWYFGENTEGFGAKDLNEIEYLTDEDGTYTLTLVVRDEDGGVGTASLDVTLQNVPPQFEVGDDELLLPPVAGAFNRGGIRIADPGADVWSGTVNYHDGMGEIPLVVDQATETFSLNHTFSISGRFEVVVTVHDGDGGSHSDTFKVEVILNTPPDAQDDAITLSEDISLAFSVLNDNGSGRDVDAENNIDAGLTVAVSQPARGSLTNHRDGTFTFDPIDDFHYLAPGESATEEFEYRIFDAFGESDSATATITVSGTNDEPTLTVEDSLVEVAEGATAQNRGSFADLDLSDAITVSASAGQITHSAGSSGEWQWSFASTDGPNETQTITITATDQWGATATITFELMVENVAPTLNGPTFEVVENTALGTIVGKVTGHDPGTDVLTYEILDGTGAAAFAVDPATGSIRVTDPTLLDFETTTSFGLLMRVCDEDGACSEVASVTLNLLNQASISGVVFVDVNLNGLFDSNEMAISSALIELLDEEGELLRVTATDGGFYLFDDLNPGTYRVREVQPTGVGDGMDYLGSLGGTRLANDLLELRLDRIDGTDYDFAEQGLALGSGQTAGIGFWQNKHGQELIAAGGEGLARWLTANFGNVFGDHFYGASGDDVARFYKDQLFKQKAKQVGGPPKVDAQFMAIALSCYFTNRNLAGDVAVYYGFQVSDTGLGARVVNVGTSGAAFGVTNHTTLTIMQLLWAANALTDQPDDQTGFAYLYDRNGNGVIEGEEAALRTLANTIFSWINEQGGL